MSERDMGLVTVSTFVDTIGDGLWMVGGALFFVRAKGFPVVDVGIGLTISGLLSLPAGIALARLADRRGSRGTYLALTLIQSAAFVLLVIFRSFALFVMCAAMAASANQGAQAIRSGLIRSKGGADAVRFRSRLHAVMNVGISIGAAFAGVAIAVNTPAAYKTLMLGDAVTFAIAGLLMRATTRVCVVAAPTGGRFGALRDGRYLTVAAVDGILDFQFLVSGYLLPLWVVLRTQAPRWLASPLLLLNTAIIVLFQVRFSSGAKEPAGAARSFRRGAATLAIAAVLFGISGRAGDATAIGLLVAAIGVHSVGELLHASGAFGLSYGLAPQHSASEYQAVWSLGMGMARAFGPAVLTLLCIKGGLPGWLLLSVAFAAAGLAAPPLARRVVGGHDADGTQHEAVGTLPT